LSYNRRHLITTDKTDAIDVTTAGHDTHEQDPSSPDSRNPRAAFVAQVLLELSARDFASKKNKTDIPCPY